MAYICQGGRHAEENPSDEALREIYFVHMEDYRKKVANDLKKPIPWRLPL
jgi:hypothetical protein